MGSAPRIVATVQGPREDLDPAAIRRRNEMYLDALRQAGAEPIPLDETATADARSRAFAKMDGLLLTGGADIDPSLYGEEAAGSEETEPGRDALEREAWDAARSRGVPVLGICRGFQAINVFSGGSLVQHVDEHRRRGAPLGEEPTHELRLSAGTRVAQILADGDPLSLMVNTSHHQAVRPEQLGSGLRASGISGDYVEALEDPDAWIIGVQCHPERTANTPPAFERLWRAFVRASSERQSGPVPTPSSR